MNGAAESLLADLIDEVKKTNKILADQLKAQAKVSAAPAAAKSSGDQDHFGELLKSLNPVTLAMKALGVAGGLVANLFAGLGSIIGKTIAGFTMTTGNLVEFGIKAAEGKAKLSDLYAAFKDLPFFLGEIMGVFAKIVAYSETLLTSYQHMSNAGASFSGDLYAMRNAAAKAQMGLQEFERVVIKNSEFFATMGGNVQQGIDKFVLAQDALIGPNSQYANAILGLGVSAEEAGGLLVSVMKSQGVMGKQGAANANELAMYTASYITQLDELGKITGKRKDQIDAEVQKAEQDDAYQIFLDSLTPDEAAKAKSMLAIAETYNGKAGVEQMKLSLRGIDAPIGKLSQGLAVASGGLSTSGEQYRKALRDSSVSVEEAGKRASTNQIKVAGEVGKFADTIGTEGLAAGAGINYLNSASVETSRKLKAAGGDEVKMRETAKKQQEEQAKGNAATLAQAQLGIKNFGNSIVDLVTRIIGPFATSLVEAGKGAMDMINAFMQSKTFKDAVADVTAWFKTTFAELKTAYSQGGIAGAFSKLIDRLISGAETVWEKIGPPITAGLTKLWEAVKPGLAKVFEGMLDFIIAALRKNSFIATLLFGKTETEKTDNAKSEISRLAAQLQSNRDAIDSSPNSQKGERLRNTLTADNATMQARIDQLRKEFKLDEQQAGTVKEVTPRFSGGPISKPGAYLVGEKGPEVLNVGGSGDVTSNENLNKLLANASNNNNLAAGLQQLNTLIAQLLTAQREGNDYARRNVDATKAMSGNLFA